MEIINEAIIESRMREMIGEIKAGKLFVYPTDTIYGVGCDATNGPAVRRVREIKRREAKPFSVIAPSIEWIERNCIISSKGRNWLDRLPGPYTLILRLSRKDSVAKEVNEGLETLGVRIPDNWFAKMIEKSGVPFVTTSVNLGGRPHMTSIDDIDQSIRASVDYLVYEGPLRGRPSKVIDLAGTGATVRE
ncbi:MAG: threonylcarbamoyl-AMP synthase [Candidatus Micrarchaeota archaeon]|nr:threonylcarbamoyl-AMP synthase [Candidatus Micrarchaeota archaeon]